MRAGKQRSAQVHGTLQNLVVHGKEFVPKLGSVFAGSTGQYREFEDFEDDGLL